MSEVPEQVTPVWLTHVLRRQGVIHRAEVRAVRAARIGAEAGFTGELTRFELDYTESEPGAPATLVGKVMPKRDDLLLPCGNEAFFYRDLADRVQLPVPRCYAAVANADTGFVLLEDLSGLRAPDLVGGCTREDIALVLDQLARMHRHWWDRPELEELSWLALAGDWAKSCCQPWIERYPAIVTALLPDLEIPARYFKILRRIADGDRIFEHLSALPRTLLHADLHADNLFFGTAAETPVIFFDWEITVKGRGPQDVGYFLISSVPVALRRRHEEAWLRRYHDLLVDGGVCGYSFEDCWSDYRLSVVDKMLITVHATVNYDNSSPQRRAWRTADLERILAFLEDHAVDELL